MINNGSGRRLHWDVCGKVNLPRHDFIIPPPKQIGAVVQKRRNPISRVEPASSLRRSHTCLALPYLLSMEGRTRNEGKIGRCSEYQFFIETWSRRCAREQLKRGIRPIVVCSALVAPPTDAAVCATRVYLCCADGNGRVLGWGTPSVARRIQRRNHQLPS